MIDEAIDAWEDLRNRCIGHACPWCEAHVGVARVRDSVGELHRGDCPWLRMDRAVNEIARERHGDQNYVECAHHITVQRYGDGYQAWVNDDTAKWEAGGSPAEAIQKLFHSYPAELAPFHCGLVCQAYTQRWSVVEIPLTDAVAKPKGEPDVE